MTSVDNDVISYSLFTTSQTETVTTITLSQLCPLLVVVMLLPVY